MSKRGKYLIIALVLLVISIIYTVLVKNVDVAAIGPEGSSVGFSSLNGKVHEMLPYNETFYKISKYAGILPFLLVALYGLIGILQLVKEKSLVKVDKRLYGLATFYALFAAVYIFFEKVIINYRPVILDEGLEASYPSSHTLLALCLCFSSKIVSKYFIKNDSLRKIINIGSVVLAAIIVIARIISGVHWISDILGGILISCTLLYLLRTYVAAADSKEEKNNGGNN